MVFLRASPIMDTVNDAELRRMLAEQSPWRSQPEGWEQDDADVRASLLFPLDYEPEPLADIRPPGLYLLRGPRRVGKSLELKRAISRLIAREVDPKLIFYCSCDTFSSQNLRRLVVTMHSQTRTLRGPRYWFLDEVTAVTGWSKVIKGLRDQDATFREACIILSGSSARDLREATDDLADRRGGVADTDRLLLPMGFRAFCGAVDKPSGLPTTLIRPNDFVTPQAAEAIYELEPWTARLDELWQLYLEVGGFPRAVAEFVRSGEVGSGFVEGLWHVVTGDALRRTQMPETEVVAFLDRLVQSLSSPINATTIATDVGLRDNERVNERINDLVTNFLAWRCYRIRGAVPNPAAQRKIYFIDPLVAQLAHRRNSRLVAPDLTRLHEQQVGLALTRAISRARPATLIEADRVMYERTATDSEIDFVGPELSVPFECKYTDASWRREAQTMRSRYGKGVMVTKTPLEVDENEAVWAVPAGIFAWLLDH
jgi:predicted AAA+ superfamily ATPase